MEVLWTPGSACTVHVHVCVCVCVCSCWWWCWQCLSLRRWEHHLTHGPPPLGVWGYASCHKRRTIFYFGGECGHGSCAHNSLTALNLESLTWNQLMSTSDSDGPMKKSNCGALVFEDQLLVVGGVGYEAPVNPSSASAKYEEVDGMVYTNEHHVYDLGRGEHLLKLALVCVCTWLVQPPSHTIILSKKTFL